MYLIIYLFINDKFNRINTRVKNVNIIPVLNANKGDIFANFSVLSSAWYLNFHASEFAFRASDADLPSLVWTSS